MFRNAVLGFAVAVTWQLSWSQPRVAENWIGPDDEKSPVTATARSNEAKLNDVPIRFRASPSNEVVDYDGAYWRIFVTMDSPAGTVLAPGDSRSPGQIFLDKVKAAFWKSGQELLMTLRPIVDGVAVGPPVIVVHLKSDGSAAESSSVQANAVSQIFLTPASKVPNAVDVQITIVRANNNETKALSAIADFAGLAAPFNALFKTGLPMTVAKQADLKQQGSKIEASIGNLLSSSERYGPRPIAFNPLPSVARDTTTWTRELSVYGGSTAAPDYQLLTLYNVKLESLLGTNNLLAGIPADPTDIKSKLFVTEGADAPKVLKDVIRTVAPELHDHVTAGTMEEIQSFCRKAHSQLSSKLGLERYDRAAVIWAYLVDSDWSRRGSARPTSASQDSCIAALREAGASKLPKLKLPPSPQEDVVAPREQVWAQSSIYRGTDKEGGLIPIAIQKADAAAWESMFGESVRLSAGRRKITLGGKTLEAGDSIARTGTVAAALLKDTPLVWNKSAKGEPPCFNKADAQTTRRAFAATGTCLQLKVADGTIDLPTEFVVEPDVGGQTPKIIEVRFFSN